ncbi:MAG: hypothetical protein HY347_12140 [candidate division NC10 bacterium]|nr:hypothetical protein [candidate division NC10 bacterium]
MDHTRDQEMRRYLLAREAQLLAQLPSMGEEELRWTVRIFADGLDEASKALLLKGYSEYLPLEAMRAVVAAFIPQYTRLALQDLDAKSSMVGEGLRGFTDEELQGMSSAEKWGLLAKNPDALTSSQVARELARLLFCRTPDLFLDPSLPLATIEYPAYFEVQEALAVLPDDTLQELKRIALDQLETFQRGSYEERQKTLDALRGKITEAIGLPTLDALSEGRMERIPRKGPILPEEPPPLFLEDMSLEELRMSLKVLADFMSLEEFREGLLPLKDRYPSFYDLPEEELKSLLRRLAFTMGDRTILDYTARALFGRMVTGSSISPEVWALLPEEEKLQRLLADCDRMDLVQAARHISRTFLSPSSKALFDVGVQLRLLDDPRYRALQDRLILQFASPSQGERLRELNRQVTALVWEMEGAAPEAREGRFQEIREAIAKALSFNEVL